MSDLAAVIERIKQRILITDVLTPFVRFQRRGNRVVGLCPFHNEKSPSFNIDVAKGSYKCFGCGKHGDHLTFLTEHQGMTFQEALKHLADKAGVELPKPAVRRQDASGAPLQEPVKRVSESLLVIMEMSALWYQEQLHTPAAQSVREYLANRGMSTEMITLFRVGFAPAHESVCGYLLKQNIKKEQLVSVGLITESGADRFKGRLMFPIMDAKGKVIAFGGRALQKDQIPKYLNSPETPLFHKSSVLYAQSTAFTSVTRDVAPLIVEGYMDVITLHQYGFKTAVAPLGTALTDDHLKKLWQRHPSPVFCFDGDTAGKKAAFRAAQRVFPLLKPHFSAQFCFLPEGEDPDTYLKTYGEYDFHQRLSKLKSLAETLWGGYVDELKITADATPEQKTVLKKALHDHVNTIQDEDLKKFFFRDLNDRLYQFFAKPFLPKTKNQQKNTSDSNFSTVLSSEIVQTLRKVKKNHLPAKILLATLKNNPTLIGNVYESLVEIDDLPQELDDFRDFLCHGDFTDAVHLESVALSHGHASVIDMLDALNLKMIAPFALKDVDLSVAESGWIDVWQQCYFRRRIKTETVQIKARLKNEQTDKQWQQWQSFKTEQNIENSE